MSAPTVQQFQAIQAACDAILDAVKAAGPDGAPAGVLYAALMQYGCTLNQFEQLTGALIRAGKLHKAGHLLTLPPVGAR